MALVRIPMSELRGLDKTIQELRSITIEQENLIDRSLMLINGVLALYRHSEEE